MIDSQKDFRIIFNCKNTKILLSYLNIFMGQKLIEMIQT